MFLSNTLVFMSVSESILLKPDSHKTKNSFKLFQCLNEFCDFVSHLSKLNYLGLCCRRKAFLYSEPIRAEGNFHQYQAEKESQRVRFHCGGRR